MHLLLLSLRHMYRLMETEVFRRTLKLPLQKNRCNSLAWLSCVGMRGWLLAHRWRLSSAWAMRRLQLQWSLRVLWYAYWTLPRTSVLIGC